MTTCKPLKHTFAAQGQIINKQPTCMSISRTEPTSRKATATASGSMAVNVECALDGPRENHTKLQIMWCCQKPKTPTQKHQAKKLRVLAPSCLLSVIDRGVFFALLCSCVSSCLAKHVTTCHNTSPGSASLLSK